MFQMNCQKITTHNIRHEKRRSKIKPIKTGKAIETMYCLGCKDYTDNFKPQEMKMTNKVVREKSNCVFC